MDNNNRGFLIKNKKKVPGSRQPDATGTITCNGVEFEASAWLQESKEGEKYYAIAVSLRMTQRLSPYYIKKEEQKRLGDPNVEASSSGSVKADDDLPF